MYDLLLIPRPLALAAGARFLAAGVNVERDAAVGSPTVGSSSVSKLRKANEVLLGTPRQYLHVGLRP